MIIYDTIYKLDNKGGVRTWRMERDGDKHRVVSGKIDGTETVTGWTTCEPTNEGRANERSAVEQAIFEVKATYEQKLKREYHLDLSTVQQGAHYFKPMLAEGYKHPKKPADKVAFEPGFAQPKLDGMRCIATAKGLFSRTGENISYLTHIHEAVEVLLNGMPEGTCFDGEIYNHDMRDEFEEIMSLAKKQKNVTPEMQAEIARLVQFHIYDFPYADAPFEERFAELHSIDPDLYMAEAGPIRFVETVPVNTEEEYDVLHGKWCAEGYEGSMLRRNAAYEQKRTYALLKRKDFDDDEFDIAAILAGNGNWAGVAKMVRFWMPGADRTQPWDEENTFGAGIRGSKKRAKELLTETHKVATVRFFGYTNGNKPRFGVVTRFHGEGRTD